MSRGTSIFKVMIDDVSLLVVKARIYVIVLLDFINILLHRRTIFKMLVLEDLAGK